MFRIVTLRGSGGVEVATGPDAVVPPPPGETRWVLVSDPAEGELALLGERFGFHPLALEDCAHLDQRPKLEDFGDHTFLVVQSFCSRSELPKELEVLELHAFLGERYLVTVHSGSIPAVEHVWGRVARAPSPLCSGVDFLYYLLADGLVDEGFPLLDQVGDELEAIEDRVLERPKKADFARILELKRILVHMRKALTPQRDMMVMLSRRGDARVSERTAFYFRDVHDHLARLTESVEAHRELLNGTLEAYLTGVSNRTNEVMKYLTVLSAMFLPLSFLVGFFGQNFVSLPGLPDWVHSDALGWFMLVSCLLIPVGMLGWFKYKGWIGRR